MSPDRKRLFKDELEEIKMKIALVMEWSTCTKNEIVYETLKKVAEAN